VTELSVIAVGGMLGASARYGIARWLPVVPRRFPWATFWTNLSGSFLLGVVLIVVGHRPVGIRRARSDPWGGFPGTAAGYLRLFLATGILGAFTTMSSYVVETALLLRDGHAATAVFYGVGSLLGGLASAYVGLVLARRASERWEGRT
jgi:CrcB protein